MARSLCGHIQQVRRIAKASPAGNDVESLREGCCSPSDADNFQQHQIRWADKDFVDPVRRKI